MRRREFLKHTATSAVVLSPLARHLIWPVQAAQATTKVALVKTVDRAAGIAAALKLLAVPSPNGKKVLIKPNFNTADPTPGSTHNDTLRQLVLEMKERGATKISVGDRSGPPATRSVIEAKGIPALAQELGFDVLNFEDLTGDGWVHLNPAGSHWQNGFDVARPVVEAEYLLWTCCLKTHGSGGTYSMAIKLAVGTTNKSLMRELHGARQTHMRRMIAEIHQAFTPRLIVMDGVDVFVDGGPSNGKLARAGVIVAGTDRIAIDAVGLAILKQLGSNDAIMSTKIFEQEQLQRAVELGLGISKPDQIDLVTADTESRQYAATLREILAKG
jgi:uncharacterized protein (DUF362 family)